VKRDVRRRRCGGGRELDFSHDSVICFLQSPPAAAVLPGRCDGAVGVVLMGDDCDEDVMNDDRRCQADRGKFLSKTHILSSIFC